MQAYSAANKNVDVHTPVTGPVAISVTRSDSPQ